ncbi:MAG: hypothetical protein GXX83_00560 [Gaiellales bacterium]|nr:hypothetical protein [Gaiellales bacterium]
MIVVAGATGFMGDAIARPSWENRTTMETMEKMFEAELAWFRQYLG